jgi:hypothetical protein
LSGISGADHPATSWFGPNHTLLQPSHPFTEASWKAVTLGVTTRYDIALLASFAELTAGTRLQLQLNSQAPVTFHLPLIPTPQQQANLAGGIYTIGLSSDAPSLINMPLALAGTFRTSSTDWAAAAGDQRMWMCADVVGTHPHSGLGCR